MTPGLQTIEGVPVHDKDVAVKTDHYTVTPGMMGYFFYTCALDVLEQIKQTKEYDETKLLHDQMYDESRSYYDMIMNEALAHVCKMLIYCEAARAEGVTLSDEERLEVEEMLTAERVKAARDYSLEFSAYLKRVYGPQMTVKDMQSILEMETLASSFSQVVSDRMEASVTPEQVQAYLDAKESIDRTPSRNISFLYIPFAAGKVNAASVNRACEAMQKTPTVEALKELAELGSFSEEPNLTPKNSGVPGITSWLFAKERSIGDWGRVDVEGATYILLYTGNGLGYDEVAARMELFDAAYAAWHNSFVEALEFGYNYDCLDGYDLSK